MTSLRYPGLRGQLQYLDSERVPYLVLPQHLAQQHGLELGDIGAVIYRNRIAYAIYADNGPETKLGEGSIKLAEDLGHAPWRTWVGEETLTTHGAVSTAEVEYLIFPGTRPAELKPETIVEVIRSVGGRALSGLIGGRP